MRIAGRITFALVTLTWPCKLAAGETNLPVVPKVAITNPLSHREQFKGKRVEVTGYYLSSFECSILSEHQGDSGRESIGVGWGIKPGHKDRIQFVEKGKVRVVGTFDFNKLGSGHMGVCGAELRDLELFEPLK